MNDNMLEPHEVLHDVVKRLDKVELDYMLTGSMAMIKYTIPRYTMDVDIVITLDSGDVSTIIQTFEPDYYVPHDSVRRAIARKGMFNIIHYNSSFKIDCIVKKDNEFQRRTFENRKRINYLDFDVWIIDKEDLIISKLFWAKDSDSEVQMRDVKNLMRTGYDTEYIKFWTRKLGVYKLFSQCQKEIEK
jgi:hypothetical protein